MWASRLSLKIEVQLADAIDLLVGSLRAGAGVLQSLETAVEESRYPLKPQLEEVLGRIRYGDAPQTVFRGLTARVPLETFRLFASALSVHGEVGGSLASTLASVGRVVRDRIELSRRIRSMTVQSRASILAVLVVTYFIGLLDVEDGPAADGSLPRHDVRRRLLLGLGDPARRRRLLVFRTQPAEILKDDRCNRSVWMLAGGLVAIESLWALRGVLLRSTSKVRIAEYLGLDEDATEWDDEGSRGLLGRWLALAGFRSRRAVEVFAACTILMILAGLVLVFVVSRSRLIETAILGLGNIPGAVGEIFVPVIRLRAVDRWSRSWALAPWSVVRSRRRQIIMEVERDLPLVLELLATLAESGLGFDAAIARIIDAQPATSPLTIELRNFQRETLTGRPRVESLRRLAKRLDVQSLTIFISAIVHAEQVGTGISDVLRRQADDVRDRRRDRALNLAQSLPVKLLFPLVMCFLPAIFVFTLGPVFLQFFQFAEAMLSRRSLR